MKPGSGAPAGLKGLMIRSVSKPLRMRYVSFAEAGPLRP